MTQWFYDHLKLFVTISHWFEQYQSIPCTQLTMSSDPLLADNSHLHDLAPRRRMLPPPKHIQPTACPSSAHRPVIIAALKTRLWTLVPLSHLFSQTPPLPRGRTSQYVGNAELCPQIIYRVNDTENRIGNIEDGLDHDGAGIAMVRERLERLEASNKT